MPDPDEPAENSITCPICGYQSPKGATKCEHCYSSLGPDEEETDAGATGSSHGKNEDDLEELRLVPGVGEAKAETLYEAGYRTLKDLQKASVDELSAVKGIGEKLATKIIHGANNLASPGESSPLANWLSGEDEGLSEWLSGEERTQPGATAMKADTPRDDTLVKWLSGEEEDVNVWLQEPRAPEPAPMTIGPNEVLAREAELIQLRETMRDKLSQFESGDFDPQATIEELAKAKGDLEIEKEKAKQLEEELENVKRGSIAVIKFIKNQQGSETDQSALTDKLASEMANRENLELQIMQLEAVNTTLKEKVEAGIQELPPEAQELKRKEMDLTEIKAQLEAMKKQLLAKEEALSQGMLSAPAGATVVVDAGAAQRAAEATRREQELATKVLNLEGRLAEAGVLVRQKDEMLKISGGPAKTVDKEVMRKLEDAQRLERTLAVRDQELQRMREDFKVATEDLQRLKEPMKYKEEEMLRREEDLMFRERVLQEELKKVTQSKAELASHDELSLKKRLEELQAEVNEKEENIRNKEKYLSAKEEELRLRQQGVISDEIEKREQDRMLEVKQEKVKTGTTRLDDLLLGGMPFGSNVLIYGPPFTGKEVLLNVFMAEGLKKGIPVIWILTEKSPKEIREEMTFVVSGYEEYEKLGLVRYVDAYSRSMGDESEDPYAEYVESPTDYESIQRAVETAAKPMREKHEYYRVGFRSISTLIAYLDPGTAFRFLSPVVGRRKRDKAVAMYTIEKGVHGEQEIQMIGSLMDGMIEFKVENLNTFLAIRGICDVQSRSFIRYSATKVGVTIGSFSLDHIR
jgi:KaiC/GvpD/RAD55 family RecA-like ATPase